MVFATACRVKTLKKKSLANFANVTILVATGLTAKSAVAETMELANAAPVYVTRDGRVAIVVV